MMIKKAIFSTLLLSLLTSCGGSQINALVSISNPGIVTVSSPNTDGTYYPGDEILIHVTFDQAVTLEGSGAPALLLETGSTDRSATYTGMSGTETLVFSYMVQPGDTSADLNTNSTARPISLGGRTLKGKTGNDASLEMEGTSLAATKRLSWCLSCPAQPLQRPQLHLTPQTKQISQSRAHV